MLGSFLRAFLDPHGIHHSWSVERIEQKVLFTLVTWNSRTVFVIVPYTLCIRHYLYAFKTCTFMWWTTVRTIRILGRTNLVYVGSSHARYSIEFVLRIILASTTLVCFIKIRCTYQTPFMSFFSIETHALTIMEIIKKAVTQPLHM